MRSSLVVAALLVLAGAFWWMPSRHLPRPQPTDKADAEEEGEGEDFARRRSAWIESLHTHAPGLDWRRADAQSREKKSQFRLALKPEAIAAAPAGTWHERGARNQAGRTSDVDYDAATDRLTAFSFGGQLWRSLRASLAWQPLNDARQFPPTGNMQHFRRLAGATERLLAADDTQGHFYYSDNQGASWSMSGGFAPANWYETIDLAARDAAGSQVYALVTDYNFGASAYQSRLLVSADRGASFSDLGFIGSSTHTALFAPGQGSNLVYLLAGSVLKRIESNNTLTTQGTIATAPVQSASDKSSLAGGIASGTPFLFAFLENAGHTSVFRSLDGGATWFARGSVPTTANIRVNAGSALHDPSFAFYGGLNLYRSIDGGSTFLPVNDWADYYDDPAHKLHADISFVRTFADSGGNDVVFVGNDGGLFQSTDHLATVSNLSLSGMRQAQYYDSYTRRTPPYTISIGAQDQGYQSAPRAPSGIANYTQVISGDYAHLTSSDGGATLWMNYPDFTLLDAAPASNGASLVSWDFSNGALQGTLFLAPMMADPLNSHIAWLAGGASTAGVDHVIQLSWNGTLATDAITSQEGSFDFGGQVTALAYSPQSPTTHFAVANAPTGSAARFFRSSTPLGAWTLAATNLPQGQYFYGTSIAPDPVRANTIYVGGSGYSGPGVYVSIDNGDSFAPMATGLPNTLVYALAISPDGNHLFAATQVGPYYYDRATSTWVDIGAGGPDNVYWHVDFVPALNTARFSTYGRGLWDFELGGGDLIFRDDFD